MIHKVSELIEKVRGINDLADRLHQVKYVEKRTKAEVDHIIAQIKYECLLISKDNSEYVKQD